MLISVIVPVYNVEQYLEQCLDSLVKQTYSNIEILCVNDGSVDSSKSILERYAKKDGRIKIINQPNRGLSAARNAAIRVASGDIFSFVDSDDYIDLDTYRLVSAEFCDPSVDIVELGYSEFFSDGSRVNRIPYIKDVEKSKRMFINKTGNISSFVCCKCMRRQLLGDIRFPEGKYYEDNIFNFRIIQRANKIKSIDRPLYHYRQRDGSITKDVFSYKVADIASSIDDYYDSAIDVVERKNVSLYLLCNIRNRIEFAIYNYGMKGGVFYHNIYSSYIIKYRKKGVFELPFLCVADKIRMSMFCYFTKIYMYLFAAITPMYKCFKNLKMKIALFS